MSKVSIIIPVYNASRFLDRCLQSILEQTFNDFEVIAVDDGSADDSGSILDAYALSDSRIKVIHKNNGGVASARQAGIEAATGAYAIHVDPDDWIEPNMIQELVYDAESNNAGMVICDYFKDSKGQSSYIHQRPSQLDSNAVLYDLFQQMHGSCCNKLISSAYYNKVNFETGLNLSEDLLYNCKILLREPKISYLPKAFYHYTMTAEPSLSKNFTRENFISLYALINRLDGLFRNNASLQNAMRKSMFPYLACVGVRAVDLTVVEYITIMKECGRLPILKELPIKRKVLILLAFIRLKKIAGKLFNAYSVN